MAKSDTCALGHSWEVTSGDFVECIECGAEGEVQVTSEPDDDDED
jgi:hypothetical protein